MSQRFELKVRPADIAISAIIKAMQTEFDERLAKLTSALTHSFSEMTWELLSNLVYDHQAAFLSD